MPSNLVRTIIVFVILAAIVPLIGGCSSPSTVSALEIRNISSQLNCPCGDCTLVLSDCACDQAVEITDEIEKRLSRGESEQQIFQVFRILYGQGIFS
jgi:cytochrome c-type biogenesis protein CcmH/NrfF